VTRRRWLAAVVVGLLAAAFVLMVGDALAGGDWPGWDEGWAVLAFPLGVPVAVAAGLAFARGGRDLAATAIVTGAVWGWGALLFLLWLAVG
jgi:uncharacterized membrane protein YjjP (DUF1212 family)